MPTETNLKRKDPIIWTKDDLQSVKKFFSVQRSLEAKKQFEEKIGHSYQSCYRANQKYNNPKSLRPPRRKSKPLKESEILVTHVHNNTPLPFVIKIGEVVIETYSKSIKINDVFIEV